MLLPISLGLWHRRIMLYVALIPYARAENNTGFLCTRQTAQESAGIRKDFIRSTTLRICGSDDQIKYLVMNSLTVRHTAIDLC